MSYAAITDIESEFKDMTFNASTFVTDTDVTAFLEEADALINSIIGKRYLTPVVAPAEALALLRMYERILVAERVRKIFEVKQATSVGANQSVRGMISTADILKELHKLADGETDLPGVDPISTEQGFSSEIDSNSPERIFQKDLKQW